MDALILVIVALVGLQRTRGCFAFQGLGVPRAESGCCGRRPGLRAQLHRDLTWLALPVSSGGWEEGSSLEAERGGGPASLP